MPIALPGSFAPDTKYTINLEGQGYDIRLRWNNRSESWFLYLGLTGADPVFKTRLTTISDILRPYRGRSGLPPGKLYLLDRKKVYGRPTREDFGIERRFQLVYVKSWEEDPFDTIV